MSAYAFLLVNRSFTSAIALVADTVFILDAPQGDPRAGQDSSWIGKLFPGHYPPVFVAATDMWPHIAGLRYWAANGATVVGHPLTAPIIRAATDCRRAPTLAAAADLAARARPFSHGAVLCIVALASVR